MSDTDLQAEIDRLRLENEHIVKDQARRQLFYDNQMALLVAERDGLKAKLAKIAELINDGENK